MIRPTTVVVVKLNDGVGDVLGHAVMGEQGVQEGTERPVRIQLQREVFSPRILSLVMSFEGTMVLNAEL